LRLTKIMEWLRKVGGWESARDIFAENLYSAQHYTPLAGGGKVCPNRPHTSIHTVKKYRCLTC
jgi:hypothetical protein